jgi:predicted HAD superfamily hydrolase
MNYNDDHQKIVIDFVTHTRFITKSMTLYFIISAFENVTIRTVVHCHIANGDDVVSDVAKYL